MVVPAVGRLWQRWLLALIIVLAIVYFADLIPSSFHSKSIQYDASGNPIVPDRSSKWIPGSSKNVEKPLKQNEGSSPGSVPGTGSAPKKEPQPGTKLDDVSDQSTMEGQMASHRPNGFIEAAHRLKTADEFKPHIKAVTSLPALPIADAKMTCKWTDSENVNFQFTADTPWVLKDRDDRELARQRKEWHDFVLNDMIPYDEVSSRFVDGGRGVVVVAGDGASFKRLKVLLSALLELKTVLPVEVQYYGDEMGEEQRRELRSLFSNISFVDLSDTNNILNVTASLFLNYNFKTAALINSQFAEPLLLDSDNVPAADPAGLYNSPTYREYGSVFWPDIARTRPSNPMWPITDTPCRPDEYEQESGQLLVDKRRFFYHLQLANHFIGKDYYKDFLLGDKDMFRFAWHALKTKYGRPKKWVTSIGFAVDSDEEDARSGRKKKVYCGHSFAQHHPDTGAIAFVHGGLIKTLSHATVRRLRAAGGMFQAYKRSPRDEDKNHAERVGIKFWDSGQYVKNTPSPDPDEKLEEKDTGSFAQCTDMFDVEYKGLELVAEGFERLYAKSGGYWIVDDKYYW